jgi:hypothetical protein
MGLSPPISIFNFSIPIPIPIRIPVRRPHFAAPISHFAFRANGPADYLAPAVGRGDVASIDVIGLKARPIHNTTARSI